MSKALSGYRALEARVSVNNARCLGLYRAYYMCELKCSFEWQSKFDLHIIRECVLSKHFYGTI